MRKKQRALDELTTVSRLLSLRLESLGASDADVENTSFYARRVAELLPSHGVQELSEVLRIVMRSTLNTKSK